MGTNILDEFAVSIFSSWWWLCSSGLLCSV